MCERCHYCAGRVLSNAPVSTFSVIERDHLRQLGLMSTLEKHLLQHLNEFTKFARKRLADPELADEAVQESLLKAFKASGSIRQNLFFAFIYNALGIPLRRCALSILRRAAQSHHRRRGDEPEFRLGHHECAAVAPSEVVRSGKISGALGWLPRPSSCCSPWATWFR